jgi:hypothetical protein
MDKERKPNGQRLRKSQDYQVMGKYLEHTRRVFTVREILHIRAKIMRGTKVALIAADYRVDNKVINKIFSEFTLGIVPPAKAPYGVKLGHKSEAYYATEEEMLEEPTYSWEELSKAEKEWYLERTGNPKLK